MDSKLLDSKHQRPGIAASKLHKRTRQEAAATQATPLDPTAKMLHQSGLTEDFRKFLADLMQKEAASVAAEDIQEAHKKLSLFWRLNTIKGRDLSNRILTYLVEAFKCTNLKIATDQQPGVTTTHVPASGLASATEPPPGKDEKQPKKRSKKDTAGNQ